MKTDYRLCITGYFQVFSITEYFTALHVLAEEVGVEPTRHTSGTSLVLKTRRPTGDIALP